MPKSPRTWLVFDGGPLAGQRDLRPLGGDTFTHYVPDPASATGGRVAHVYRITDARRGNPTAAWAKFKDTVAVYVGAQPAPAAAPPPACDAGTLFRQQPRAGM
ncbi:MAG: hypothetical protein JSR77_15140 [Planctomycetes bacterium]|nr:hypothetical protein [Planctomycetota bacterium]